jgi:hypothetical protein
MEASTHMDDFGVYQALDSLMAGQPQNPSPDASIYSYDTQQALEEGI